jgi:hypothetical protein
MYLCARGIDSIQSLDSSTHSPHFVHNQYHSLSRLCTESIPLSHKYIVPRYPGFVQNQYPSHTSTSSLTIQALYRINTPCTQVHRHSLSRLCIESIPLAHKYIVTHYPGFVQNQYPSHTNTSPLTIQALYKYFLLNQFLIIEVSVQSLDSEWRCTCVRGVLILYKAWIVSDDVLVCEGY